MLRSLGRANPLRLNGQMLAPGRCVRLLDGDELQVYRENDLLRVQQLIDGKAYDVLSILDGSSTLWTVYHGAQAWQRTAKSGDGWLFLTLTMHAAYSTIITEGSNG